MILVIYVIARNEAIANYVWRTCTVRDCHAIAHNDIVVVMRWNQQVIPIFFWFYLILTLNNGLAGLWYLNNTLFRRMVLVILLQLFQYFNLAFARINKCTHFFHHRYGIVKS